MNFIKEKVYRETSYGMFIASGAVSPAEIAAGCGYDWLLLDMEHGLGDENVTKQQIIALTNTACAPLVRIPALRREYVKRILDFGAAGLMCPMIRSREDAEELVTALRYPPEGARGLSGGSRAASYGFGFKQYFAEVNHRLLGIAQIENAEAVADVDGIASVDGIDVLFIGHSDLSLNLGVYGKFDSPEMIHAEQAVLSACRKYGKVPGMLLKQSMNAADFRKKGFRFLALGTDHGCMKQSFRKLLDDIHQ